MISIHLAGALVATGIVLGWLITEQSQDRALDSARRRIERDRKTIVGQHEELDWYHLQDELALNRIKSELGATEIVDW